MVRAGSVRGDLNLEINGYTLGELRAAISQAERSIDALDTALFGKKRPAEAGAFETQARSVVKHYQRGRELCNS
jgi:hypothetical protein